jgi:hypothetical protein
MDKIYRVVFECYDKNQQTIPIYSQVVLEGALNKPTNCMDFTMGIENQISLIQNVQDIVLTEKASLINSEKTSCQKCTSNLAKCGHHTSTIHDVFTDHEVKIQRLKCRSCKYEAPSTIRTILNGTISGDLVKVQATLGADYTYRESEKILKLFSLKKRQINNHDRVKHVVESIGNVIERINEEEKEIITSEPASELILNIDGGHIKTVEDTRSMEAMVAVVYKPEALKPNNKDTRNHLTSKNCAASIKNDNQHQMISNTIIAALKQGLNKNTHVTALCDGAENCWTIAKSIEPLCGSISYILDWFHISMKMENISLPEPSKCKFMRIKWHLWRGNSTAAILRLKQLIDEEKDVKNINKLSRFLVYIENNNLRIVNYRSRQKQGIVFTSNLAECTVESLINQRCKGQQHMRWSRDGLNPLLQLRASIHSNEWVNKWQMAVLNAAA